MAYMISGLGVSGKYFSVVIGDHYKCKRRRIVLRLSADVDLISGRIGDKPNSERSGCNLGINVNIGIAEIVNKEQDTLDKRDNAA